MTKETIDIGDKVSESGMGAGVITGFSDRDYPKVNNVSVSWLVLETGEIFDPHGVYARRSQTKESES